MLYYIQPTRSDGLYMVVPLGAGHPDQGLPGHGHPDQGLPGRPHRPNQGLPGHGHPDHGLPGQGGHPDHGLPAIPGVPDNTLPSTPPPSVAQGDTLIMIRMDGTWHWASIPAGETLPEPLPEPEPK